MPKRKEKETFADTGNKECWHSYSLQVLQPTKFSSVVGKILSGNYTLIVTKLNKSFFPKLN